MAVAPWIIPFKKSTTLTLTFFKPIKIPKKIIPKINKEGSKYGFEELLDICLSSLNFSWSAWNKNARKNTKANIIKSITLSMTMVPKIWSDFVFWYLLK